MAQAQEMQMGLLQMQNELIKLEVKGFSKDKLARIVMNAQGDVKSVDLEPELLAKGKDKIEKAVLEAIHEATEAAAELAQNKMAGISKQMGIQP